MDSKIWAALLIAGSAIIFMAASSTPSHGQVPDKAFYELRRQCGRDADDFLERAKAGKISGAILGVSVGQTQEVNVQQTHYSAALNKCFVVMSDTVTDHTIGSFDKQRTLWDINARVTLGFILTSFGPEPGTPIDGPKKDRVRVCYIEYPEYDPRHFGHCESDDQWGELIRFYTERP